LEKKPTTIALSSISRTALNSIYDQNNDTYAFFVPNAPGMITDNINVSLGIVNGAQCILHSLNLNPETSDQDKNLITYAAAGGIIEINIPLSINVELKNPKQNWPSGAKLESFQERVIIPIGNSSTKHTTVGLNKQLKFGNFSVDIAFSITYHKIQGQTLERIIVDLNHIPSSRKQIDFASLFVGLSRVKHGTHIRILPLRKESEKFLKNLEPAKYIKDWHNSYQPQEPNSIYKILTY